MSARPPAPQEPESERELATSRLIEAPRERVFAAFRDPARLARWWGPKGFRNTFQEFDLKPGGRWLFVMHGPDGGDYPNESVFVEVKPPKRIVFNHVSSPRFEMTITFEDERGRTRVGWRQLFETAAELTRVAKFAEVANEQNLDRLANEVARV
jgi:uncharacterized protein YndB with AHSA1/START domain